jgi:hypothetical protein
MSNIIIPQAEIVCVVLKSNPTPNMTSRNPTPILIVFLGIKKGGIIFSYNFGLMK